MYPLGCFQPFLSPPVILVTPSHQTPERPQDAMAVWMEDSREDSFKICLKESKIFDGVHKNIEVVSLVEITKRPHGELRTVPTIVTAHIFCACQGSRARRERNANP